MLSAVRVLGFNEPELIDSTYVTTEWPFLIDSPSSAVQSLDALDSLCGAYLAGPIGRAPRWWFDDELHLKAMAQHVETTIDDMLISDSARRPGGRWASRIARRLAVTPRQV